MSRKTLRCSIVIAAGLLAGVFVAPIAQGQTQPGSWSMAAPLPVPRTEMKSATIDGKIYLVGGSWDEALEPERISNYTTGFLTEYDPQTNSWRERARAPEGLTHQAVAALDGKLYVLGGFGGSRHTRSSPGAYVYDPATDDWETLPSPPSGTQGGGVMVAVGGMIHTIGGRAMGDGEGSSVFADHNVYDPSTNAWREAAPLPTPRDHAAGFVFDGKIHVIGGRVGETDANVALHDIYDPVTDRWMSAPPMPTARSSLAYAEYRGKLFVAGGECKPERGTYEQVEAYDPASNSWQVFSELPTPRHAFAAGVADGKLFFFGGSTNCGGGGKVDDTLIFSIP
jgi:N-acetylneuraminic acid mutarotase